MIELREDEKLIYEAVSRSGTDGGISPSALSKITRTDLFQLRRVISSSPLLTDLCFKDPHGNICPMICGSIPHFGLEHFSWYYSTADVFLQKDQKDILDKMEDSCLRSASIIGTPRFPKKKAVLIRCTIVSLFKDLELREEHGTDSLSYREMMGWEISLHTDISTKHGEFRTDCDALLISPDTAFAIYFTDANELSEKKIVSFYERSENLQIVLGEKVRVLLVIVMLKVSGMIQMLRIRQPNGSELPAFICSRDRMYEMFDID